MHKLVVGSVAFVALLVSGGFVTDRIQAADRARPILIGALNASWGPTPQVVGLRDGLEALGYRENTQLN